MLQMTEATSLLLASRYAEYSCVMALMISFSGFVIMLVLYAHFRLFTHDHAALA